VSGGREQIIARYLEPTPLPPGVTSREIVCRAIEFDGPARIPFSFIQPFESDFCEMAIVSALLGRRDGAGGRRSGRRGEIYYDEWGVGQEVTGRGWDHAADHPLADLAKLGLLASFSARVMPGARQVPPAERAAW